MRQLHNLQDDESLDKLLAEIWGQVRSTPADKAKLIAEYRELLAETAPATPDLQLGRAVFAKTCQQCHTLYGVGANIGPDLTGSNRADLEYLLSNIVDPSAVIAKEYQPTVIVTDGRPRRSPASSRPRTTKSVTLRTATETIVLPKDEIDERELSETSMMPDDQLKQFSEHEIAVAVRLPARQSAGADAGHQGQRRHCSSTARTSPAGRATRSCGRSRTARSSAAARGLTHNTFLVSDLAAEDFQLVARGEARGQRRQQRRAVPLRAAQRLDEMRGYQADIGAGWWGKLYEENGRALLWDKSGEQHVKKGDWNQYEIEAVGSHIRTWINGQPCVDLDDPDGKRGGIFALQLHSGEPTEVRFRNLQAGSK